MKKVFIYILLLGLVTTGLAQGSSCDIHALADQCKKELKPFLYSNQNALHIALKSESQSKDVALNTMGGEKYRIVINTTSMPKGTHVDIYDADNTHKKRKQFFSTEELGVSSFDTDSKAGKLFIEYSIPAASTDASAGCAVIMIGYENKFTTGDK
jgi:hypothetical protein